MLHLVLVVALCCGQLLPSGLAAAAGDDVAASFAMARRSGALRVAAIGGSITQAGEGWIAPWLGRRLPGVAVTMRNAGWSATGSEFAVFRLARDVLAADPGLVLIETAVNDSGLTDDEAVRNCESVVRRLAMEPRRPGMIMVLAARLGGIDHARQRAVADRYGIICVDMQAAVAKHTASGGRWEDLFSDDVHPTPAGHALYADALSTALEEVLARAAPARSDPVLPAPLARLPLRLDGRMWTPGPAPGWRMRPQVGFWWDSFLLGSAEGADPAQPMVVAVRGTDIGIHVDYGDGKTCGTLLASVDGAPPREVPGQLRSGSATIMLASDLPPGEHRVVLAVAAHRPGPVRIAYVLAAGAGDSPPPSSGPWDAARLAGLRMEAVPARMLRCGGPVGPFVADSSAPEAILDHPPQAADWDGLAGAPSPPTAATGGMAFPATDGAFRGCVTLAGRFTASAASELLLGVSADYFARVLFNGTEVMRLGSRREHPQVHVLRTVGVRAGVNELSIVLLPGSRGFSCDVLLERPVGGITWEDPRP